MHRGILCLHSPLGSCKGEERGGYINGSTPCYDSCKLEGNNIGSSSIDELVVCLYKDRFQQVQGRDAGQQISLHRPSHQFS